MVERLSGERFDVHVRRTLLQPLGIAGFHPATDLAAQEENDLATLYRGAALLTAARATPGSSPRARSAAACARRPCRGCRPTPWARTPASSGRRGRCA
jgi:CubicO group peptidase (beta-lactamase class C family)